MFLEVSDAFPSLLPACSRGSVVVDFTIFAKDSNAAKEAVSTLKAEVANGKFGFSTVDGLTLQVPTTPAPDQGTPHACMSSIISDSGWDG